MADDRGMFWSISLACDDPDFLEKWGPHFDWNLLPKGPLQYICAVAIENWKRHKQPLDWPAMLTYLEAEEDAEAAEEVRDTYIDLINACPITDASRPNAWEEAVRYLQNLHVGGALDRARSALVAGDRELAFATLLDLHDVTGREEKPPVTLEEGGLGALLLSRPDRSDAVPTGIYDIDRSLEGGLYPGNFGIVLAPTNVGKSMTLCYLALSAYLANKRVLYFTYELTKLQIAERILCGLFRKPKQELDPARIDNDLMYLREERGLTRASLSIEDGIETVADLRHRLEEMDADIIILDSADDMTPEREYKDLYGAQGEIYSRLLRRICQDIGMPVWTSTQATRDAMERDYIGLKHMGDSFIKARRAHIILGLAQNQQMLDDIAGPLVRVLTVKDTLHGSRGSDYTYSTTFGRGDRGYPSFSLHRLAESV